MITPLDIKKQTFERTLRGYNTEEVEDFLSMISVEWELMLTKLRATEQELKETKEQLDLNDVTQQQRLDQLEQFKNQDKKRSPGVTQESQSKREQITKEINELEQIKSTLIHDIHRLLQTISGAVSTYSEHPAQSSAVYKPDNLTQMNVSNHSNPTNIDYIIDEID